jgi:hypothetical protein
MWISIKNDGPELVETNFWDTEIGKRHYAYAMTPSVSSGSVIAPIANRAGAGRGTACLCALSRQAYQSRVSHLKTESSNSETTGWSI